MAVADRIQQYMQRLPERLQVQVLDFIELLLARAEEDDAAQADREWSTISLSLAMRGMEEEDEPEYSISDLKESYK